MKKGGKLITILFILIVIILLNTSLLLAVNVDPLVEKELKNNDEVKIIVRLKDNNRENQIKQNLQTLEKNSFSFDEIELKRRELNQKRNQVKKQQDKVIDNILEKSKSKELSPKEKSTLSTQQKNQVNQKKIKFNLKNKYSIINAFSAKVNKEALEILKNDPNVESIELDKDVKVSLDASIPLIDADDAWNVEVNGINITGAGQTVCIIDTGINYGHSALGNCSITQLTLNGNVENLSTPIESDHNYSDSYVYNWTIQKSGYENIAIHFRNMSIESNYDQLELYDSNWKIIGSYSGIHNDIWSPSATGDTIHIIWETDSNTNDYGIYIDQTINGTTATTYNWSNCSKVISGWDFYNSDGDPMDDHNHGTHCAGIVASEDSTYKGVAPDAKLIAIKALSASGSGTDSDVAAAIDWCVNKSSDYNISVISMSLGCEGAGCIHYQTNCDSDLSAEPVAAATELGIAVVIAAGNDGWTNGTSNPSCVSNAIPVGAVNDADNIYYNRGNLLKLLAPGVNIYSTSKSGGFYTSSGTSMSTPHVAGAAALMQQYWQLVYNQTPTPAQIENKLFITGKTIDDTNNSGNNYSRIKILDALKPYINFTSTTPENDTTINQSYITVDINSDVNLTNAILEWNYLNGTIVNYSMNLEDGQNYNYTLSNLKNQNYSYQVYGNDSILLGESENRIITLNCPIPIINVYAPTNNSVYNNYFSLNVTIESDDLIGSSSYNITNSSGDIIQQNSNNSINQTTYSWNDLINISNSTFKDGNYTLNVLAEDETNNVVNETIYFIVDKTYPSFTTITKTPTTNYNEDNVIINVTINDNNINNSKVYLESNHTGNWINYSTNYQSYNNFIYTINSSYLSNQETVFYKIHAYDLANNYNYSLTYNFTVQNRAPINITITNPTNGSTIEIGNSTTFSSSAIDLDQDTLTYNWTFSDSTTGSGQNYSKSFNTTGSKTITLNVTDQFNSSNTTQIIIYVNDTQGPTMQSISYDSNIYLGSEENQTVNITLFDYSNILNVTLLFNGTVKNYTQSGNNYYWNWLSNFTTGNYNFTISAYDNFTYYNLNSWTYNYTITSCGDGTCNSGESCSSCSSDCGACSSGGGGGGSSSSTTCYEDWQCSSWNNCNNERQTRICTDSNDCGSELQKPITIQSCIVEEIIKETTDPTTSIDIEESSSKSSETEEDFESKAKSEENLETTESEGIIEKVTNSMFINKEGEVSIIKIISIILSILIISSIIIYFKFKKK